MQARIKKQIYIGVIISLVVGAIGTAIYFIRRKTTNTVDKKSAATSLNIEPKVAFPNDIIDAFDTFLNANAAAYGEMLMVYVSQGNREYTFKKGGASMDDYSGIASMGKYLAAAVIMSLVDEGKINLDASLSTYLPWIEGYSEYNQYTIRDILSHQTGIVADSAYDNNQNMNLDDSTRAIVNQYPFQSGIAYPIRYSSSSYKFAARVAEIVSGLKWEALFKERIAEKCDMKNTFFNRFTDNPDVGKGAQSSPSDFSHFMEMIRNDGEYAGQRVLSAASVREMEKLQGGSLEYGLGCWVFPNVAEVAAQGARGGRAWVNRNNGSYAVVFTQQDNSASTTEQFKELVRTKLG